MFVTKKAQRLLALFFGFCLFVCFGYIGETQTFQIVGSPCFSPASPTTHLGAQCGVEENTEWQRRIWYIVSHTLRI